MAQGFSISGRGKACALIVAPAAGRCRRTTAADGVELWASRRSAETHNARDASETVSPAMLGTRLTDVERPTSAPGYVEFSFCPTILRPPIGAASVTVCGRLVRCWLLLQAGAVRWVVFDAEMVTCDDD